MAETADDWAANYGYVPAKRAGGLVFISGVVGMDENGAVPTDPVEQFRLAFAALDGVLQAEGLTKDKLIDLMSFHANYPDKSEEFIQVKKEYLGDLRTAWTAVGATLATPEMLVEIRAVAEA